MALTLSLDGLPVVVPDTMLNLALLWLDAQARQKLEEFTPRGSLLRTALKPVASLLLPRMRAYVERNAPGYPPPDPPRHCDLIGYLTDYWLAFFHEAARAATAEMQAQTWEVFTIETPHGLQITGFAGSAASAPADAEDAEGPRRAVAGATAGGEPEGGATTTAADRRGDTGEPERPLVYPRHDRDRKNHIRQAAH